MNEQTNDLIESCINKFHELAKSARAAAMEAEKAEAYSVTMT